MDMAVAFGTGTVHMFENLIVFEIVMETLIANGVGVVIEMNIVSFIVIVIVFGMVIASEVHL